jgi:CRISPR-associated endonuclease/helicase Cas3
MNDGALGEFELAFEQLTGHPPFPWQRRLYERMRGGDLPDRCDIPTGLGKTAVVGVWLIALACLRYWLPSVWSMP